MNFGETDEQQMIRGLVRDFAETVYPPWVSRPEPIRLRRMAGLPRIRSSRHHHSGSLRQFTIDDVSEAIIIEELARVDPSLPSCTAFVSVSVPAIALHGDGHRSQPSPRLAAGRRAPTHYEAGAGTDAAAMSCKAKLSDDGTHYILNGEKCGSQRRTSANHCAVRRDVDTPTAGQARRHHGVHR